MQGACVYTSIHNIPTIIMYKELIFEPGKVIIVLYRNKYLLYKIISTKLLTNIIPINSIDIFIRTNQPFYFFNNSLFTFSIYFLRGLLFFIV